MQEYIKKLKKFVDNGGRMNKNREPQYGEAFYDQYMCQYINRHYNPGDRIKVYMAGNIYEGILLRKGQYHIELLTSGKKVHKDRRNLTILAYGNIKEIKMIEENNGNFDPVNEDSTGHREDYCLPDEIMEKRRRKDKEAFQSIYKDIDYDHSHIIKVQDGCRIYFPFYCEKVEARIFVVRENGDKIAEIPCSTSAPFPNKCSYHAGNSRHKDEPDLYTYLPDNGFVYEDVNLVCMWIITTEIMPGEKPRKLILIDISHIGQIQPVKEKKNLIKLQMDITPVLGYDDLSECSYALEDMMNHDMYGIINAVSDDDLSVVDFIKGSPGEGKIDIIKSMLEFVKDYKPSSEGRSVIPYIEFFRNDDDDEPVYSDIGRKNDHDFKFIMLEQP